MRALIAPIASLVGSVAFQMSVDAGWFHNFGWAVPWVWALSAALWSFWLVSHPRITDGPLKNFHTRLGRGIHVLRFALCLVIFILGGLLIQRATKPLRQLSSGGSGTSSSPPAPNPVPNPASTPSEQPSRGEPTKAVPVARKKPVSPKTEPPPVAPSPSYTVTNPTGSIVNQGTTVNGSQTVNVNADRDLTADGAQMLKAALQGYRGVVYFSCVGGGSEEQNLAMQLAAAISLADGWTGKLGAADEILGRAIHGIEVDAPNEQQDAAKTLVGALDAAGLSAYQGTTYDEQDGGAPANVIIAYIGSKQ